MIASNLLQDLYADVPIKWYMVREPLRCVSKPRCADLIFLSKSAQPEFLSFLVHGFHAIRDTSTCTLAHAPHKCFQQCPTGNFADQHGYRSGDHILDLCQIANKNYESRCWGSGCYAAAVALDVAECKAACGCSGCKEACEYSFDNL